MNCHRTRPQGHSLDRCEQRCEITLCCSGLQLFVGGVVFRDATRKRATVTIRALKKPCFLLSEHLNVNVLIGSQIVPGEHHVDSDLGHSTSNVTI